MESEVDVTLREINEDNLWSILDLAVEEDQEQYVAPNAVSLAEAHFSSYAWFRAIYAGEEPVGFVMLFVDEEEAEYDLWRMMIDSKYQGQGYGGQALQQIITHVRGLPDAEELTLSYLPGDGDPGPFFEKYGFKDSNEWVDDEKILILDLWAD